MSLCVLHFTREIVDQFPRTSTIVPNSVAENERTYSLRVVDARSLKSKGGQGPAPPTEKL